MPPKGASPRTRRQRRARATRQRIASAPAACALAAAVAALPLHAAVTVYSGPDGNWSTAANWSLATQPHAGDIAILINRSHVTYDAAATPINLTLLELDAGHEGAFLSQSLNTLSADADLIGSSAAG